VGHAPFRNSEKSRILWLKHTTLKKLPQWKITEIVAIRLQILRRKCTKFDFGWCSAPDPAGGKEGRGGEGDGCPPPFQNPKYATA